MSSLAPGSTSDCKVVEVSWKKTSFSECWLLSLCMVIFCAAGGWRVVLGIGVAVHVMGVKGLRLLRCWWNISANPMISGVQYTVKLHQVELVWGKAMLTWPSFYYFFPSICHMKWDPHQNALGQKHLNLDIQNRYVHVKCGINTTPEEWQHGESHNIVTIHCESTHP